MKIGNLNVESAAQQAAKYGFPTLLGGRYCWQSIDDDGSETIGTSPRGFQGEKQVDSKTLPSGLWYDPRLDILAVIVSEDYYQGQTSSAYFGR